MNEYKLALQYQRQKKIHYGTDWVNWIWVKSNQMEHKRNESAKTLVEALLNMGM